MTHHAALYEGITPPYIKFHLDANRAENEFEFLFLLADLFFVSVSSR